MAWTPPMAPAAAPWRPWRRCRQPTVHKTCFAPMRPAASRAAGGGPLVQPTLRTKFADTALWVGNLTTENNGTAEVALDMPENLTTWRIKVWGMGHGTKVGQGQTDVITRKDLIVRLRGPAVLRPDRRGGAVGHRA